MAIRIFLEFINKIYSDSLFFIVNKIINLNGFLKSEINANELS
jgi:hypothetical protein